jgi:hypothetical protein
VAGDPGRKMLMRALKPMCGHRLRSFFLAQYDLDRSSSAARAAFIARVRAQVTRFDRPAWEPWLRSGSMQSCRTDRFPLIDLFPAPALASETHPGSRFFDRALQSAPKIPVCAAGGLGGAGRAVEPDCSTLGSTCMHALLRDPGKA